MTVAPVGADAEGVAHCVFVSARSGRVQNPWKHTGLCGPQIWAMQVAEPLQTGAANVEQTVHEEALAQSASFVQPG
ncbi:hypothetical protein KBD18_01925 [Patescibacteria group bacterium]|nr:hypothetical protein [Patescibacteria group bacterium]